MLLGVLPSVLRTVALPLLAAVMGEGPPVHCLCKQVPVIESLSLPRRDKLCLWLCKTGWKYGMYCMCLLVFPMAIPDCPHMYY